MPNLLHINLADNRLASWNKNWFQKTPLLNRISFQNNSIAILPRNAFENLKGAKSFGKLDLSINLVFSYNKIKEIDLNAFGKLDRIRNLWLDHNELETFDEKLLENVEINDLRIDHNKIKCLEGDYDKLFKANSTHIDLNPFDCSCLDSIKKYAKENEKEIDFYFSEMDCTAQRIREKMDAVQKRLKEISQIGNAVANESDDIDVTSSIKKQKPVK